MESNYPVFIEISQGTKNNKYERDPKTGELVLDFVFKNLIWPFNYGEIPNTLGGDGDRLDAIVFSSVPLAQGETVLCTPFGVMRSLDRGEVDDKLLMVPTGDLLFQKYHDIGDFTESERQKLRELYAEIAKQKRKTIVITDFQDKQAAIVLIESAFIKE